MRLQEARAAQDRAACNYSRVEVIWGIAPVRPGPYVGYLSPSRNRLCRYCIAFRAMSCDVMPHIMHEVTFTSPLTFHILFCLCVCDSLFGHLHIYMVVTKRAARSF
jgi:hypothetical protein